MRGAFDNYKDFTYADWKKAGGCTLGEADELSIMEALGLDIVGIQGATLRQIYSCGEFGAMAERAFLAHFIRMREGMDFLWE